MASESKTMLPCPCGAAVDWDECPYPLNRDRSVWTVRCVREDCGWSAGGGSADEAMEKWNDRASSAEAKDARTPQERANAACKAWAWNDDDASPVTCRAYKNGYLDAIAQQGAAAAQEVGRG